MQEITEEDESFEGQRYGRNKETQIDNTYIDSGEYRRKFDLISDNDLLNKRLYELAKKMLKHRAGTLLEDMYWITPDTAEVVASETNGAVKERVDYSDTTRRVVDSVKGLITIHTHPHSYPPSVDDFNSNFNHEYALGIICCHNGRIFVYNASEEIDKELYSAYIQKLKLEGKTEFEAQWTALELIRENSDINFKEVGINE